MLAFPPAELRGVYESDAETVLQPPPGSRYFELRDDEGEVVSGGWVIPRHKDNPAVLRCGYQLVDDLALEPTARASAHLQLVNPSRRLSSGDPAASS